MMIFSKLAMYQGALDASSMRHRAISNNLANADTPNYRSQRVTFEEQFKNALGNTSTMQAYRTNEKHIAFSSNQQPIAQVVQNPRTFMSNNGNGVDVDYEMAELAKNQLKYDALIQRTQGFFNSMQTVIKSK